MFLISKKIILVLLTGISISVLFSCNKNKQEWPQPAPETLSYVQFSANAVQLTNIPLFALISIKNSAGQEIITNKKVTLDYIQGVYKTDKVLLNKGEHKLTKFIVHTAADSAVYAVPLANSAKSSQVTNPLDVNFTITTTGVSNSSVQVLKVMETDAPNSFGYNENDFGFVPFISVVVKLKVNIGQVEYDSLPGKLLVNATDNQGGVWLREIELKKGITQVRVPENYSNFKFEVAKWNLHAIKNYVRTELQPLMTISLEATSQPKKLVEEAIFIETVGGLVPDSRTEYFYNVNSRLQEIKNYQKTIQSSSLRLTNVYKFRYSGAELDTIYRYDSDNLSTGFTAFFYNGSNISNISNKSYDQETNAAFEYLYPGDHKVINGDYLFSNMNSMSYTFRFLNNNKVSDLAQTSTGGFESGVYEYDDYINPKYQLGYPDLYLTNYSKNNLAGEHKNYGGAFPTAEPYKFEYSYNNDGYPSEVFISYKGYTSQQHLYRIKKVFKYQ